jgi:hypothetical protein
MSLKDVEDDFPNLQAGTWRQSSERDDKYNCIAFAVHDTRQFWDPDYIGVKGYYWPPGIARNFKRNTLIRLFELHGYKVCANSDLEPDFEKIAIYSDPTGEGTHAARQKASGVWTSKLGYGVDIEHNTLEGLHSDIYGEASIYMRRKRIRGAAYE